MAKKTKKEIKDFGMKEFIEGLLVGFVAGFIVAVLAF